MPSLLPPRAFRLAAVAAAALCFAACAKNNADEMAGGVGRLGAGVNGGGGIAAPGSPQDFASNVGDRVFFESDQTELNQTAQATLDKQARWLSQYARYDFTVEGHADERGTREYNFALGARRAEATKDYLVAKGVSAARIHTISYGK